MGQPAGAFFVERERAAQITGDFFFSNGSEAEPLCAGEDGWEQL